MILEPSWQPIETCPRENMVDYLLCAVITDDHGSYCEIGIGWYDRHEDRPDHPQGYFTYTHWKDEILHGEKATHWYMKIPEPPKVVRE